MKTVIKRMLSILLAVVLVFGVAPLEILSSVGLSLGIVANASSKTNFFETTYGGINDQTVNVGFFYEDLFFSEKANSGSLNENLALSSAALSAATYDKDSIATVLQEMGFVIIKQENYGKKATKSDCEWVAFTIAKKPITLQNKKYYLYAIFIRGTTGNAEWYNNFDMGSYGAGHKGFLNSADKVMKYIETSGCIDTKKDNNKLWICGHSRGAAVANIIAGRFSLNGGTYAKPENIYGYTYACPNVKYETEWIVLNNIYNFNNPSDLITELPLKKWGFDRYGKTILMPQSGKVFEVTKSMFKASTGETFKGKRNIKPVIDAMYSWVNYPALYYDKGLLGFSPLGFSPKDMFFNVATFLQDIPKSEKDKAKAELVAQVLFCGFGGISTIVSGFLSMGKCEVISSFKHAHSQQTYIAWMEAAYNYTLSPSATNKLKEVFSDIANAATDVVQELVKKASYPVTKPNKSTVSEVVNYKTGLYKTTAKDGLNLRQKAGTTHKSYGLIPYGTELHVTQVADGWGKTEFKGNVGWIRLYYAKYLGAIVKPAAPNLKLTTSDELGKGEAITVKWDKVNGAKKYTVQIKNADNGKVVKTYKDIKETSITYLIKSAGEYLVTAVAENSVYKSPVATLSQRILVHPDVNITFVKDGNIYQQQTLTWGHDLETLPELPTKKGNAFKGWYDSELTSAISFKNITSDIEAHAAYVTSKFTVKFAGPDGTLIGDPQIVEYGKSAVEPSSDAINDVIDTGRKFIGWNKDFSCVVENMTVTAVTDAENQDIPVEITDASAIRHEKNYVVTCNVNNLTRADVENGRVVVALKTEQGKLVTTTESAAYFLDANYVDVNGNLVTNSEFIKVVVPVIDADKTLTASVAEVYAINNYQSLVPISSDVEVAIVDRDPWGEPTTERKTGYTLGVDMEEWIEYRSRELMLTDTTNKDERDRLVNDGWVLYNTTFYKDKNSGTWTKTKPSSGVVNEDYAEKTVTDKAASTVYKYKRYKYYNTSTQTYWYSYASGWATNHGYSGKWEYKTTTEPLEKIGSSDGWYKYKGTWYSDSGNKTDPKVTTKAVTHKEYRVFNTVYTYYLNKQPETFSSWTRTPITETSTIDVEERTVYRYKGADINRIEDNSGEQRDEYIYDYLGKEFAGKQVILAIYKINEASDWTLEHIDQTVVNSDGTYEFEKYKLREDLSETTGDLTVVLGVEGTKEPIYLGKIEAPKPKYTVTFVDDITGDIISTQTVEENCDAVVPETAEHEGYTFAYWNNCSTDIRQDLEVRAMYKKNVYTVVWIDYLQEKYELEFYEHGDNLVPPFGLVETAEQIPDGWDNYISGNVVPVTSNMVIAATYKDRTFIVDFLDFDGNIVESQTVKYGETPEEPNFDYDSDEHCILFGFESKEDFDGAAVQFEDPSFDTYTVGDTGEGTESEDEQSDYIIIEDYPVYNNCQIVPKFEYIETTEIPTVDIKTGTYSETQVVTIDCDTDNASIFITFDGTDPVTSDTSVELAAPATVHISESQQIRFYASAFNMNPSAECSEWYAINNGNATNDYILKLAAYDDETELYTTIVGEGSLVNESLVYKPIGYTFDGAYKNVDITVDSETGSVTDVVYSDKWNFATDVITGDTTLYLKYDVNTYEVTFVDYDGFILSEQTVNYMESAVEPEKPTRENYVFVGWDTEEYLSVSGDVIVNAMYVHEDEYVTIDLNRTTYNIMSGNSFELQAITGGNVESPDIIWSSSNESVAIVDETGRVTAVGKGTAEIYAIVADNGETAVCTVTVSGNPSEELIPVVGSYLSIGTDGYIRGFNISTDEDTQLHHAETVADIKAQFMNNNIVFTDINGNTLDESAYVGTGTVIKFMNGTEVMDSLTVVVSGDMDGDGCVTNRDASRITRYLVNKENPNEAQLYAMDVNADGYVNNRDASIVSRYLVGKETL